MNFRLFIFMKISIKPGGYLFKSLSPPLADGEYWGLGAEDPGGSFGVNHVLNN